MGNIVEWQTRALARVSSHFCAVRRVKWRSAFMRHTVITLRQVPTTGYTAFINHVAIKISAMLNVRAGLLASIGLAALLPLADAQVQNQSQSQSLQVLTLANE